MTADTLRLPLHDGTSIPQLGLGTYGLGERTVAAVAHGLTLGYRLIDGAAIYGNETGVGEGLRASGIARDQIFVTTKIWNDMQGTEKTRRAFDGSMERLGLDRLDLILIHWPCPAQDLYVDTWRALIGLRDEGRVVSLGVSNFTAPQIARLEAETGVLPVLNQIELHPRMQQPALRAVHAAQGIVTQSWSPLGRMKAFGDPAVVAMAARLGKTPAQVILRWHLQLGLSVIPKSSRDDGLRENAGLFDFALTDDDMTVIAGLEAAERTGPDPATFG